MSRPTVVVVYSPADQAWCDKLQTHLRPGLKNGNLVALDASRDDLLDEAEQAAGSAQVAVLLVSPDLLAADGVIDDLVPLLRRKAENGTLKVRWLAVRASAVDETEIDDLPAIGNPSRPLAALSSADADTQLVDVGKQIRKALERSGGSGGSAGGKSLVWLGPLPVTGEYLRCGRESQLRQLDEAWENPAVRVASLVAWGGAGKTALLSRWLGQMASANYHGATRVFAWSFYNQDPPSGEQMVTAALRELGDDNPSGGPPEDRAHRLCRLLSAHKSLLVLDGLEVLQQPPGEKLGRLMDPALKALLTTLAAAPGADKGGLCVITTRVPVAELRRLAGTTCLQLDLNNLSPEDGAEFLRSLGVRGEEEELREAVREMDGHALSLILLAHYLRVHHDHDVRRRDRMRLSDAARAANARTPAEVMESYESWLGGGPELAILRLMGLFNGPADPSLFKELCKPPIADLTDSLTGLDDEDWQQAFASLEDCGLVRRLRNGSGETSLLAPRLVREHFAVRLRKMPYREAAHEAHLRLYQRLAASAPDFPKTPEEMRPLFQAVYHGCAAGRHRDVVEKVYRLRICQGPRKDFHIRKLGMVREDLDALSCFFQKKWNDPVEEVSGHSAWFLESAADRLKSLGRVEECGQASRALQDDLKKKGKWKEAEAVAGRWKDLP